MGKYSQVARSISKDGVLTSKSYRDQKTIVIESNHLLHRRTPHTTRLMKCMYEPTPRGEVIKAIEVLKNHKSPGIAGIPAELLKALPEVVMDKLHSVITEGWDNEYIPDDWKTSIIVPIF